MVNIYHLRGGRVERFYLTNDTNMVSFKWRQINKNKMKLITRDTDYAIRALVYIAQAGKRIVCVSELVSILKIPRPFLRKILQVLNKNGLLHSYKGRGGGFALAIRPAQILLFELMRIFQGRVRVNECSFRKVACPNLKTCCLKKKIDDIESFVISQLRDISLASLLKER